MRLLLTGHPIVRPEFLTGLKPDVILAMNSISCDEIGSLVGSMGSGAQILAF